MPNRPLTFHRVHLIYRLHNSIPAVQLSQLRETYREQLEELARLYSKKDLQDKHLRQAYQRERDILDAGFQQSIDEELDRIRQGPTYLKEPQLQKVIIDSWLSMERMGLVLVYAVCVMPNHVHALVSHAEPEGCSPLAPLMEKHKRFTGTRINKYLGIQGQRVWDSSVFDRDVRPGRFDTVFWYILKNPVKAGFCQNFEEWTGSYWRMEREM